MNDPVCQTCHNKVVFDYTFGIWLHEEDIDCGGPDPLAVFWPAYPDAPIEVGEPLAA